MMLFTPAAYKGDKYLLKRQTSVLQAAVVLLVLVATIGNVLVILSVQAPSTLHKSYYHTCTNHTIGTSTNHTIGTSTFHLAQIILSYLHKSYYRYKHKSYYRYKHLPPCTNHSIILAQIILSVQAQIILSVQAPSTSHKSTVNTMQCPPNLYNSPVTTQL